MNYNKREIATDISISQVEQFRKLVMKLFQCCQERMNLQSDRFGLPDAEIRCLLLFGEERYLTAKGIASKLNVVKSRVSKIVDGLIKKQLIYKVPDPEDSRITLLCLTNDGHAKLKEITHFMLDLHSQVLALIHPDKRNELLSNLDLLRVSMETINEALL